MGDSISSSSKSSSECLRDLVEDENNLLRSGVVVGVGIGVEAPETVILASGRLASIVVVGALTAVFTGEINESLGLFLDSSLFILALKAAEALELGVILAGDGLLGVPLVFETCVVIGVALLFNVDNRVFNCLVILASSTFFKIFWAMRSSWEAVVVCIIVSVVFVVDSTIDLVWFDPSGLLLPFSEVLKLWFYVFKILPVLSTVWGPDLSRHRSKAFQTNLQIYACN